MNTDKTLRLGLYEIQEDWVARDFKTGRGRAKMKDIDWSECGLAKMYPSFDSRVRRRAVAPSAEAA